MAIPKRVKKNPRAQASWAKEQRKKSDKRQDREGKAVPAKKPKSTVMDRRPWGQPTPKPGMPKKRPRRK